MIFLNESKLRNPECAVFWNMQPDAQDENSFHIQIYDEKGVHLFEELAIEWKDEFHNSVNLNRNLFEKYNLTESYELYWHDKTCIDGILFTKPGKFEEAKKHLEIQDGYTFKAEPYKHFALYTAEPQDLRNPENYTLVKEFRYGESAGEFMRDQKVSEEYRGKIFVLKEFDYDENDPLKGKSVIACSVIGEYLYPEEWDITEKEENNNNIQAFVTSIAFPNTIEELKMIVESNNEEFDVEKILNVKETDYYIDGWTTPRWAKKGDIAFFMHTSTAISKITKLISSLKENKKYYREKDYVSYMKALERGKKLYQQVGGKIFAMGIVDSMPYIDDSRPKFDEIKHWKSRIYANISDVVVFENPIDISEFRDFLSISRGGTITCVFGEVFNKLREVIIAKNKLPKYLTEAQATPIPLKEINKDNWLQISGDYRNSFLNENQFRVFYTDYLLKSISESREIYSECRCRKDKDYFVDNMIWFNGKLLPVEIKLNIKQEKDLKGQCKSYTNCTAIWYNRKIDEAAPLDKYYKKNVLVIDTYGVYLYNSDTNILEKVYNLDLLKTELDLIKVKEIIRLNLSR